MTNEKQKNLKKEINELKNSLNKLNVQKEQWFTQKEGLKKEVYNLISQIKKIKFTKDKDTKEIQKLKETREKYNKEVRGLISKYKKLNEQKKKFLKDKKITFDPAKLLEKIEEMDYKIETEGLTFDKEKKLMIEIKHLKKQLAEAGDVQKVFKELDILSEKINKTKTIADEAHNKLTKQLKQDKTSYDDFLNLTKQINSLKKKQEDSFKKFIDSKNKFSEINKQLKEKLKDAKIIHIEDYMVKHNKQTKVLEEKTKEVEEKLKKKKKLTTEDLLVFQGMDKK
ncbi:hypothetical protein K8R33_05255 [archaeon]|nr:hypothetical protein [archaeon]